MTLYRLVYVSRSQLAEFSRVAELEKMLASARRLNQQNDVTGFLLATPSAFAQVLEGSRENVAEAYGRILLDPRHSEIRLMTEDPIATRSFSQWSMGAAEYDQTTDFIFGLYGVTPDNDLTEQPLDALLDLAGELARGRP